MNPSSLYQRPTGSPLRHSVRGLSLVELMVSLAIGMVIMATLAILFANNSRARGEIEKSSQRIDNGRFALELVQAELQNSGYLAEFDPRPLSLPPATPDPCLTSEADLKAALRLHVQGYNDVTTNVLGCLSDVKPNTDVLVIRRASGCISGVAGCTPLANGDFGFQASSCNNTSELKSTIDDHFRLSASTSSLSATSSSLDRTKRDCATLADIHRYLVRIYYIANNDQIGDSIPTLKRVELTGGAWSVAALVPGIENLQIEYGLDTDGNGDVDTYTPSPQIYLSCNNTTGACSEQWSQVVAAKIALLGRNTQESRSSEKDTKIYTLGRNADGSNEASETAKTIGPFNDYYKRSVYQVTVRLQNIGYRNATD